MSMIICDTVQLASGNLLQFENMNIAIKIVDLPMNSMADRSIVFSLHIFPESITHINPEYE